MMAFFIFVRRCHHTESAYRFIENKLFPWEHGAQRHWCSFCERLVCHHTCVTRMPLNFKIWIYTKTLTFNTYSYIFCICSDWLQSPMSPTSGVYPNKWFKHRFINCLLLFFALSDIHFERLILQLSDLDVPKLQNNNSISIKFQQTYWHKCTYMS